MTEYPGTGDPVTEYQDWGCGEPLPPTGQCPSRATISPKQQQLQDKACCVQGAAGKTFTPGTPGPCGLATQGAQSSADCCLPPSLASTLAAQRQHACAPSLVPAGLRGFLCQDAWEAEAKLVAVQLQIRRLAEHCVPRPCPWCCLCAPCHNPVGKGLLATATPTAVWTPARPVCLTTIVFVSPQMNE